MPGEPEKKYAIRFELPETKIIHGLLNVHHSPKFKGFWPLVALGLAEHFKPFPEGGVGTGLLPALAYPGLIMQSFDSAAPFPSLFCFRFNYKGNILVRTRAK